jgi:hypothetical protein
MARPVGQTVLRFVLWFLIVGLAPKLINVTPASVFKPPGGAG